MTEISTDHKKNVTVHLYVCDKTNLQHPLNSKYNSNMLLSCTTRNRQTFYNKSSIIFFWLFNYLNYYKLFCTFQLILFVIAEKFLILLPINWIVLSAMLFRGIRLCKLHSREVENRCLVSLISFSNITISQLFSHQSRPYNSSKKVNFHSFYA